MTPKDKMRGEYRAIAGLIDDIQSEGDKELMAIIEEWRKLVVLDVAQAGKLDALTVMVLKERLSQIAEDVHRKLYKALTDNERRLFIKGIQTVDRILKAGSVQAMVLYMDEHKLQQIQEYSAEHITGITDLARRAINTELNLAALGQKPSSDVISAIGRNLEGPSVFGTIRARARIIFLTEVNRINNQAAIDRMKQVSSQVPDLVKEWRHSHTGVPRPFHFALNSTQVNPHGKFALQGADGQTYMIDGPYDPILPVGEIVNCRCRAIPVVGRFMKK